MLVPYVTFNGNTQDVFEFYAAALKGKIVNTQRFGDGGQTDHLSEADKNKIMHIALEAPNGIRIMGNDHVDFMGDRFAAGNNFSLSIHPDTDSLADEYFSALSKGGTVIVPMSKAPWGDYFGMFVDKYGIKWMINNAAK